MTRTTPELAPPSPNFRATPTGGRLATTCDLACNRPHTRRIFSGIGFRTCNPPVETLPLGHRGHLLFGVGAWGNILKLKKIRDSLNSLQRRPLIKITKAYRTISTEALQ
ncbi:hypothetical protein AVEN_230670-1 [Araneus ventricosus]|uniref:Uncharacterized protein n=1 Tax=Araneus ventricosus TaxID=182803 RepID=A0A4Y2A1M5_ARAVE|nr:hypothetical protein AVEN_230670-1 [Araneus ventricosus]